MVARPTQDHIRSAFLAKIFSLDLLIITSDLPNMGSISLNVFIDINYNSFLCVYVWFVYVVCCMYVCSHVSDIAHTWRSENNLPSQRF